MIRRLHRLAQSWTPGREVETLQVRFTQLLYHGPKPNLRNLCNLRILFVFW
jgi:hypothetical protein